MPYQIQWEDHGAVVTFTGIHSVQEDNQAESDLFSDERISEVRYILWDLSNAEGTTMKNIDSRLQAKFDNIRSEIWKTLKVAFIVRDEHMKEICVNYIHSILTEGSTWQFNLAETIDDARRWIGLNQDDK